MGSAHFRPQRHTNCLGKVGISGGGSDLSVAEQAKSLARTISFHSGVSRTIAKSQKCIRILMYHGTPLATATVLRQQLAYFAKHCCIVPLRQLVDRLSQHNDLPSNGVVLTFDDGLRNNLTVAYPILRELRLPATFFVCPALIDSGGWLWNHEARCRLQSLSPTAWSNFQRRFGVWGSPSEIVVSWMKSLKLKDRYVIEDAIRAATPEYAPSADQKQAHDMMDWKDL